MKLLVTGGAGFIGSNFVNHFADKYEITVLDKLTYCGRMENLRDVMDKITFIKGDVCDAAAVEKAIKDCDAVVHYAAESITEDTYVPVQSVPKVGTRVMTFTELWEQQKRKNKVHKTRKCEIIFLKGKQTKVLSYLNGGQWIPIRAISRHKYKGKVIKLSQKWGIINATPNHSIYASNLELTTPTKNPELMAVRIINEHIKKYKKADKRLLEFLAAYITEGSTTFNKANGGYIIEIGQKNKEWLKNIGEIGKELFNVKYCIVKGRGVFHLQFSNKKLFEYLRKTCGYYSSGKFFPNWVFDLETDLREYFWKKLLEGDGTKDERYTTTSYKLANQISLLLALQKKYFTVFERNPKNEKWGRSWEFKTKMDGSHHGLNKRTMIEIDYDGWVYDLEVEKTHNFVCSIGNVVCHNTHVDRSIEDPAVFIKTDVLGTHTMLEAARRKDVRFVHISTDEIYGQIESGSWTEQSPLCPRNPYSASKAAADMLARAYFTTYGLPVVITRSSNNFGPRQFPEKLIPLFITNALSNRPLPVYGDGMNIRDWLYVNDNCEAIEMVMQKGKPGEAYNIGGGNEMPNIEITKLILSSLNKPESLITFVKDRPGHDRRYSLDFSKIKKLGWQPRFSFEDAMKQTVEWYVNNRWWWETLVRN